MSKRIRKLRDLTLDPHNANRGTARGREIVGESIEQLGAGRSILVDRNGTVIAGNKTLEQALALGMEVRVVKSDGSKLVVVQRDDLVLDEGSNPENVARQLAYLDNRSSELGLDWDVDVLQVDADLGLDMEALGFMDDDLRDIGLDIEPDEDPPTDDVPDPPKNPVTKLGDLWVLGDHRLFCGDSTDAKSWKKVGAPRCDACISDPPYAVDYGRSADERGGNVEVHSHYEEGSDPSDILKFIDVMPSDVLVMTFPIDRHFQALAATFARNKIELRKELVWVKDTFSFWPGAKYQQQHEPILICARRGCPVGATPPSNESTVQHFNRPKAHDKHPTMKPIELYIKLVRYHTPHGGTICEPFCGSGTTLIAAEMFGRTCFSVEISPAYCDVTVERWEDHTGAKAKRSRRPRAKRAK